MCVPNKCTRMCCVTLISSNVHRAVDRCGLCFCKWYFVDILITFNKSWYCASTVLLINHQKNTYTTSTFGDISPKTYLHKIHVCWVIIKSERCKYEKYTFMIYQQNLMCVSTCLMIYHQKWILYKYTVDEMSSKVDFV